MKITLREDYSNLYEMIKKVRHNAEENEYIIVNTALDESYVVNDKNTALTSLNVAYSAYMAGKEEGYNEGWLDS